MNDFGYTTIDELAALAASDTQALASAFRTPEEAEKVVDMLSKYFMMGDYIREHDIRMRGIPSRENASSSRGCKKSFGTQGEITPRVETWRRFDRDGLRYRLTASNDLAVEFGQDGANPITVFVSVHSSYDMYLRTSSLATFSPRQRMTALETLAELNGQYRYLRFVEGSGNTICAEADLPGHEDHGVSFNVVAKFVRHVESLARKAMEGPLARLS